MTDISDDAVVISDVQSIGHRAPVYTNRLVYTFRDQKVWAYYLNTAGKVEDVEEFSHTIRKKNGREFIATCVFREEIYYFYDWDRGGYAYEVRYKKNADPEKRAWEGIDPKYKNDHEVGFPTGIRGHYKREYGGAFPQTFKAVVFNDQIYLFYLEEGSRGLKFYTFDGKTWTPGSGLLPGGDSVPHEPLFNVVVAAKDKAEHLFVFSKMENSPVLNMSEIDPKGKISFNVTAIDKVKVNNSTDEEHVGDNFSVINGTIKSSSQKDVLLLFYWKYTARSTDGSGTLRRFEIDQNSRAISGVSDTGIALKSNQDQGKFYVPFEFLPVPVVQTNSSDFRHYLTLCAFSQRDHIGSPKVCAYPSDYFTKIHELGHQLIDDERDIGAKMLLGIIEGVPPFSRNGTPDKGATSSISYGASKQKQIKVSSQFKTSVGVFGQAGHQGTVGLYSSFSLEASFSSSNTMIRTVSASTTIPKDNTGYNHDGEWGVGIVALPYVSNRIYERRCYDGKTVIETINVVWVDDIDIWHFDYKLEDPLPGMRKRKRSSDIDYWSNVGNFPNYPGIPSQKIKFNSMTAYQSGRGQASTVQTSETQMSESSSNVSLVFKSGMTKALFQIEVTGGVSMSMTQATSTEISESIVAGLSLPEGPIPQLRVLPGWLLPEKGKMLDDNDPDPPFWIPTKYRRNEMVPWCITYRVL